MARVVERNRLGERDLKAEVSRAVAELGGGDVRVVGMVEQRVGPVVGAVRRAAERRAEDRRLSVLGEDPAELAPAPHLLLAVAVLVQAGADRDDEQVVLVEVVRVVAEALQRLHDRDDHRVRREHSAVHEGVAIQISCEGK